MVFESYNDEKYSIYIELNERLIIRPPGWGATARTNYKCQSIFTGGPVQFTVILILHNSSTVNDKNKKNTEDVVEKHLP